MSRRPSPGPRTSTTATHVGERVGELLRDRQQRFGHGGRLGHRGVVGEERRQRRQLAVGSSLLAELPNVPDVLNGLQRALPLLLRRLRAVVLLIRGYDLTSPAKQDVLGARHQATPGARAEEEAATCRRLPMRTAMEPRLLTWSSRPQKHRSKCSCMSPSCACACSCSVWRVATSPSSRSASAAAAAACAASSSRALRPNGHRVSCASYEPLNPKTSPHGSTKGVIPELPWYAQPQRNRSRSQRERRGWLRAPLVLHRFRSPKT